MLLSIGQHSKSASIQPPQKSLPVSIKTMIQDFVLGTLKGRTVTKSPLRTKVIEDVTVLGIRAFFTFILFLFLYLRRRAQFIFRSVANSVGIAVINAFQATQIYSLDTLWPDSFSNEATPLSRRKAPKLRYCFSPRKVCRLFHIV
jgi:hypothetical protein